MENIDIMLDMLSKSKFRSSFHLNMKMKKYVEEKGMDVITEHAYEIINKRIRMKNPENDGKQTPMKQVHPVFIAQHACACCCRGCLEKWYGIPKTRDLSEIEVKNIVNIITEWVRRECKKG